VLAYLKPVFRAAFPEVPDAQKAVFPGAYDPAVIVMDKGVDPAPVRPGGPLFFPRFRGLGFQPCCGRKKHRGEQKQKGEGGAPAPGRVFFGRAGFHLKVWFDTPQLASVQTIHRLQKIWY
jgi:hypothetical protein